MAYLNATEIVNYAKDVDYEYNAKIILMSILTIYILIGLWYFNRKKIDYYWQFMVRRVFQGFAFVYFLFLPMYTGIFFRTVPFDFIYNMLIVFYLVMFTIFPTMFLFGAGEAVLRFILRFFGKDEFMKYKERRGNRQ
jgi:hypothetical protein